VAISGDTGIEGDRITSNGQVKVTLSLANNLILIDGELLEVSANGATWVNATGNNKTWATADNAVTLVIGIGNLTARVIDIAGNVTALTLSDNSYTLDTGNPLATLSTTTDTKNTANVSVQSSETGTAYLVHSSVVVNVNTTQAMLDALASANKVNKVTIATANTATDLAATDLEDGVYRVYTVDIAGNISTASTATVTIDTSSPTAPISLDLANEDDSGSSNSDNLTKKTNNLAISGTAEANATVELFNGTTSLGTVTANSGGNFTLDIDLLAGSVHNITAQATDAADNVSDVSAVLAITVDTATPTITVKTMGTIAPNSNLVATFSETITRGTGDIVIKESGGTITFETLGIQSANITIGGTDNKTLTINPSTNLESGKSYYIEMASGVLTDVSGNNFAGIDDSSAWTFSAASLSTTVAWSGANVSVTDGYINTSELSTATVTGKVANPNNITGLSISEIKFFSTDSVHTVSNTLINAISIDNAGNWTLANNSDWTSGLNSNTKYAIQVKLSSTLLGNTVNGSGDTSEITIDTTIADAPVGTHTVAISNDAGVLGNDRITNDSAVKVSLTLGNNLVLATDETLQVSANGTDWVITTGSNKTWTTIDNAVTLIAGTGKTLTARVIDTAGNVTALPLSDNGYTLDTGNPLVTLNTTTDTKNTGNVSVQSSETGTAYLVHSSVVVNVSTTQAMLDTLVSANKVNKVTIATANTATDLAATDLEDGVYRVYTVDIAGNVSTASTATVTIDTSSPTAPISLDLADEDDSGSSNSDNLTKETSGLTISGTAEANAIVELFNGTTSLGTVTANSGGNFTLDIDLSAGSLHNVTAQATDAAGNVSDVSAVLAITVDTAAPTITLETLGHMAPSSNLVATFNETITRGMGDIVIKESGGTIIFETLDIQSANITIGGTDNRTLTINPSTNLESGKSYYIEIASGVLTDVAGNNFAGINDSGTWAFSAASLSTTVAWSGANVSVTDGYINTSELSTATITGKIANLSNVTNLSISEIKFFSTNSVVHTVSSTLINAISIDNAGNWTLANNSDWTSGLNSNTKYTIQVKLSGTLLGHIVNDSGEASEVTIDTTITNAPVGTHTVAISNDAGILGNDRITNDSVVKVSLTLGNNLVLATDETLQVSADGINWVNTAGNNKAWETTDDPVTLIAGTGKTLTARVIDTAGNVTALPLSDNSYTLDTGNPLVTLSTITDTKNTGNVSVQSSETGTAYLVHSSVVVNVGTTQAMLDTLVLANKVNKVTIATANTATDLAATDLEDGVYRVYTVDIAGNVSTASTATVTIDTSSPTAPISLDLANEDDSGSSNSDNLTKETSGLTISGTAEANATVELFNGTTSLGTVTVNNSGNFTLDIDLSAGSLHNVTAQATDAAGNVSDVSAVLAITVDTAAPTITVKTMGTIAPNSNLVATFSEAIAKGTGDIVIKESGGGTFATLNIQNADITIGGTDNKTLTINPSTNLESGKSYYIEMASGVLTDVAGNNFAGIDDSSAWAFSAASLSTTVAWSGANVDVTDGYINTSELSTATVTGKVANPNGITGLSISEIKFFSTDSVVHTVSSALINAISIDNAGNWTLANNSNWTSGLNSNAKYTIQVKLSGTLLGNTVNGSGDTSEVTIDTTIADAPVGTHTVAISNDAGVLDNDRITNDSVVKVSLTLGNNLVLASDETLQVSADGTDWVVTTGSNKTWATIDNAVTLITGTGKTLTARVIDTAGNVTALPLSDNGYTLDTGNPLVTLNTTTDTKNTGNVSVQSSETGTAYLVHSSVVVNVSTTQAMLDTLALANKVNKVTIATANMATDLVATDLEDGVYRVYTVDIAGNVSTASTATVTIDTSSPTAPISLDLADEDDSGSSNSDNLTKETSGLTIAGTAEANATVELFNGTTSLGTVTVNSGGNFTLDIDLLAGSVHEITAQATDAAGNVSDVSAVLAITVDTAAPTITVKTVGTIAPNSNLVATFSETITRGTGDIVIKESGGTTFATLGIQNADITIGGTDNKTLTINPSTNLESGKSYYIEMASGVLTDVAGNNFAGIDDSSAWTFSAASLSTTVAWSGANVDVTDGYINTSELSTATVTGKVANPNGITGLSISEIKFFSTDSVVHTVSSALINAISIDNAGNWTLANNSNWTSGLNSNAKYTIQVKLSGTLLGNTVNGSGDTSEVTIDTTIADAPVGTHTVAISNDAGVLDNDRITNDSVVKVSLTLGNNLVLASDETLQVSADGATWVNATGINKAWATADDAVTLIAGTGKTLTARVIDTAGNVTALPLSDNSYTLDTGNPLVTLSTITDTKNTGNVSVQSSETGTAYLVHSSVVVNVSTTQAMLDTLVSANKVNKVTIATANTATDLAATDLEDGVYRVYTVDIAGNVSTASTTTVTIDTSSPTAPISLDLADEDDSGSSNSDNLTKETSGLTISGTAEANATVELFNGTTSLGTVTANSGGNFTLDMDLLAGSVHEITAQATDAAGNVSDVSAVLAITVDTAAPTITLETLGHMAPSSNLVATFNETITRGTGDIVIKESGGTIIFETLDIQSANITIGGTDNRTLTINPSTNLESGKSYYIEIASGVLTDVAGNNFAGINDSGTWAFSAASLSTTVAWSGANVSVTDGYINTSELSTATITGKIANLSNVTNLSISEIKFFSTNSVVHTVSSTLINAISIDNAGNWTLANNSDWTSGLNSNTKYTIQVKLSGTLLGHIVNDSGEASEVTIDTTITNAPVGTHTVAISNDAGILGNDRITNDSVVKVSLTLGNNLVLATDETLQVSADGINWVNTTGNNKAWETTDDPVTLIAGTGKTLTARVIDTAGNVTALTLSDNGYTLDIVKPTAIAVVVTANSNLLKIGDTVIVTLTTDKIVNVIKGDDANTPQYEIMIGGVARQAIYKSGSGSNSLVFEYTVIPGETDTTGGITAGTNKLTANGTSTLKDIAGNDLDLNAVAAASVNTLTVNAIAPVLNTITMDDTELMAGETTTVTFTFSEAVKTEQVIDNLSNTNDLRTWSATGRASDVVIAGFDSFVNKDSGIIYNGNHNIIKSTTLINTWIIGNTTGGTARYLVLILTEKSGGGIEYQEKFIYKSGVSASDITSLTTATSNFSGWVDGEDFYKVSGLNVSTFDIADITSPNGTITNLTVDSSNTVYTATFTPAADTNIDTNIISVGTDWTNEIGNAPVSSKNSDNYKVQTADIVPPDAVDLDPIVGDNPTSSVDASKVQIVAGIAFDADIATPSATDIKEIKVVLGGATLDVVNDKLVLDVDLALDNNHTSDNITIGGITGIDYKYTSSDKTLVISKNDVSNFSTSQVEAIVEAIKLKNTQTTPIDGVRTATISYIDEASNEGTSAIATIDVRTNINIVPTIAVNVTGGTSFWVEATVNEATFLSKITDGIKSTGSGPEDIAIQGNAVITFGTNGGFTYASGSVVITSKTPDHIPAVSYLRDGNSSTADDFDQVVLTYSTDAWHHIDEVEIFAVPISDETAPTIAITSNTSALKVGEVAIITFTLSEVSTDFIQNDVIVIGGSLSNFALKTGETRVYTATFTPTANSTVAGAISVANNKFSDAVGNNNIDGADTNNSVSLAIDTEAPTAIVNTISEIAGTDFIININDKANGFIIKGTINGASDGDKVVVTFNSKDYTSVAFTSSGTDWTADVPADDVSSIAANGSVVAKLVDAAGNASTAKIQDFTVDTLAPVLDSATVNDDTLILTYNEILDAVYVPNISTFTLKVDGTIVTNAFTGDAVINATAKTVTLTLTSAVAIGAVVLISYDDPTIGDDHNTIQDVAGNDAASISNQSVTNNTATPEVNATAITATNATDATKTSILSVGDKIIITITMSETVMVSTNAGTPTYTINIGGVDRVATYASGSSSNTLIFSYTVADGDTTNTATTGITATTSALALNGGTIKDAVDNATILTTPIVIDNANTITVDALAPTLVEGAEVSGSLFGKAITITEDGGYEDLVVDFAATNTIKATFNIISTSANKVTASNSTVSYDGTVVGTIAKTVTPTFTDAVDVIVDGTKLTTTGTAGWNSGIFSLESFSANGSVSATAASNSEAVVLGLSYTNEDANYNKINYAIFLTQTSNIDIYEIAGGATINTRVAFRITSYNANDTFSIERNDNTITYLKNGTVFYTSLNTSTGNLHLDTSFNTTNSELLNVQIKGSDNNAGNLEITFNNNATQDAVNAITNAVTYTGSAQTVTLSVTDEQGLSNTTASNLTVNTPDTLAPTLDASTALVVTIDENGGSAIGDITKLTITFDGNVNGLTSGTNNTIFTVANIGMSAIWSGTDNTATRILTYTVASGQNGQLAIDETALKESLVTGIQDAAGNAFAYTVNGGNIANIAIDIIVDALAPTLVEGAEVSGSLFGKVITITEDGGYEDLVVDFTATNTINATFNIISTSANKVTASNSTVSYDGTVVGTIAKTVTPTFTDAVDVIVDGTKLTTTGTAGWNSGIFSLESFSANGSVSATAASNSEAVVLGLSYTNEDANYNKINYAIFLTQTSNIDIYEIAGGATINTRVAFRITSYNANDTFSIERNDNTITYLKNGTVFYTSLNTSTGNLHLDTSFNTTNSELLNVQIKGSDNNAGNLEITFNNNATQDAVNAITNAVTYTGSAQTVTLSVTDEQGLSNTTASNLTVNTPDTLASTLDASTAPVATIEENGDRATAVMADTKDPTITNVVISGESDNEEANSLKAGDKIIVKVFMSEEVHLTMKDTLNPETTYTIKVDGVDKIATYTSGSDSNILTFDYTVESGVDTTNITSSVNALSLGADTLKDTANRNANLAIDAMVFSRYVLLQQELTVAKKLHIGEVEIMVDGINVALNKTVNFGNISPHNTWLPAEIVDGKNGNGEGLATSLNSTNGWVQIDLGQLYNINSIKVKSTTGANNIANNPDATNDLVIFTSETSMETSPSISELRNQSNVNEIGITSGINYFNREQKFSTSNIVVKDIIIDNTIPIATMEETAALISADIEIKSNETGTAYLFKDTLDLTNQSLDIFDNYVSNINANTAIKTEISANALTKISTSDLEAGQYHLYIIDTAGNISTQLTNALTLKEGNILSNTTISNLVGGTGADTIIGGAGADTLTGNAGADIFYYGKENITGDLESDADTITDFDVTVDKLNLIDVILYANGDITDSASLAKYVHAEADTSVATNVKLYIKTQGDSNSDVNETNSNVLINFTVADATAQSLLVTALTNGTLDEYILS
jgi:hypothetical protein